MFKTTMDRCYFWSQKMEATVVLWSPLCSSVFPRPVNISLCRPCPPPTAPLFPKKNDIANGSPDKTLDKHTVLRFNDPEIRVVELQQGWHRVDLFQPFDHSGGSGDMETPKSLAFARTKPGFFVCAFKHLHGDEGPDLVFRRVPVLPGPAWQAGSQSYGEGESNALLPRWFP
jgi:hypothetical protein